MKIMWVCNTLVDSANSKLGIVLDKPESWIESIYQKVISDTEMELTYCFRYNEAVIDRKIGTVRYISFVERDTLNYNEELCELYRMVIEEEKPNVIHCFGTEYPHTLAIVNAAEKTGYLDNLVISLQGIVSEISKFYTAYLPENVIKGKSFRDYLKKQTIAADAESFCLRGKLEIQALQKAKNVIGRTEWDKKCALAINPKLEYFHCDETMRQGFYSEIWEFKKCEKHRIFVSQANYPLKGYHIALAILKRVREKYPDATLYTTGEDPFSNNVISMLKQRKYTEYLKKLIRKYHLRNSVFFTGRLGEVEMREQFLKCNVFLLASVIENSPNALCEAMLLGTPCVAAKVGGVETLFQDTKDGRLFDITDVEQAANTIIECFKMEEKASQFGECARKHASKRHDPYVNFEVLMNIYNSIS